MSTTTISVLLPNDGGCDPSPFHGALLGVESSSTTYAIACQSEIDGEASEHELVTTLTLGPWAEKSVPPGAAKTGDFDVQFTLAIPTSLRPPEFMTVSMHCDMSGTEPLECTQINSHDEDYTRTAIITEKTDIDDIFSFGHYDVTITSGADLLTQTGADTQRTSDPERTGSETSNINDSEEEETSQSQQSGSQTSSTDNAEETDNTSTSTQPSVFAIAAVASLATFAMI